MKKVFYNAILSFKDGLYRVFTNEKKIENDELSLIRVTMMKGRY